MKNKFKKDKYQRERGGFSAWLKIYCRACSAFQFYYQKDGKGILKRAYIDRVKNYGFPTSTLKCCQCDTILGVYGKHKGERPCYRIVIGAVRTQKI